MIMMMIKTFMIQTSMMKVTMRMMTTMTRTTTTMIADLCPAQSPKPRKSGLPHRRLRKTSRPCCRGHTTLGIVASRVPTGPMDRLGLQKFI